MPTPFQRPRSVGPSCVAAVCLVTAVPAAAGAQAGQAGRASATTSSDPPEARVPRIVVAGGVDADHNSRGGYPSQLALHAGYQVRGGERMGGPRFGVRLGLDVTASHVDESDALGLPFSSRRSRAFGVALLGTYALTRGPVRPYLLGGVGTYFLHSSTTYRYYAISASGEREPDRTEQASAGSVGVSAGAGLSAPVGRVVRFGEARATVLPSTVFSETPGIRGMQLPLVLGVRF